VITLTFTSLEQFEATINSIYLLLHPNDASQLAAVTAQTEGVLLKTEGLEKQAAAVSTTIPKEK
jgi:hypothetical protein